MAEVLESGADKTHDDVLRGTTLRVYRFLFELGHPARIGEIQRGLNLSTRSVAEYHVKKLLRSGLIKEDPLGYVVDRVVWENMIRMRRTVIPFQAIYAVFFAAALAAMLLVFDRVPDEGYTFGVIIVLIALGLAIYESAKALRHDV